SPPATPAPSGTLLDAFPHRSAAASARWSSDPAASRSVPPPENCAAPANPPPSKQSRVRCRCPRNTQSAASGNTAPAPAKAAPSAPHRSARIAARPMRQSRAPPALGSAARRTDAPPSVANPCARSKAPLVVAAALFGPSPCAHSTNQRCGSHNLFPLRNPDFHHGLLGSQLCRLLLISVNPS